MTPESGFCGLLNPASDGPLIDWPGVPLALARSEDGALLSAAWHSGCRPGIHAVADRNGVAFRGEIFNADELARELGLASSATLTQLVRAGWQRWSAGLLPRLDGVFALVVRDGDDLALYRDASGMSSLYCHAGRNGQIAFATHLDTLLRLPGTERRLARPALHEYLRFLDIAAPHSIYQNVVVPEAGQLLRWSRGRLDAPAQPKAARSEEAPTSFEEAVDRLDAHLQRSVQARLANAERPAAFLSGGVDSALLCALAARCRPDTTAVTVGFDGAAYDEAPVAARIAAHLGLRHEVLRFSREQTLAAFERLSRQMEQPMADPATPATLLAFEHCRGRFDTVLDGTGADEAVGMLPPRHVRLATGYASLLPRSVRAGLTRLLRATPGLAGYAPIVDFEHPADTVSRWKGFSRHEIEGLCGEPVAFDDTQFFRTYHRFPRGAHFERYSALLNAMPCERLCQATLISGARVRYPFCDARTDRFLRQLRTDFRYLPGQPKRILRALLARYVPMQIWDAPKHGFTFPLHEFLAADGFQLVRRFLDADRWRKGGALSHERVAAVGRQYMAGDRRLLFRVWALVVLGAWLEQHELLQ